MYGVSLQLTSLERNNPRKKYRLHFYFAFVEDAWSDFLCSMAGPSTIKVRILYTAVEHFKYLRVTREPQYLTPVRKL